MSWMEVVVTFIKETRKAHVDFELYVDDNGDFRLGEKVLTRQEAAEYTRQFNPWLSKVIGGTATTEES